MFMQDSYGQIIRNACGKFNLNPEVIAAIIYVESGGDAAAFRYEPKFYDKYIKNKKWEELAGYKPKHCNQRTEGHARAISWGLMQVLGQTARELDYRAEFLTELCTEPEDSVYCGCAYFDKCLKKESDNEYKALLRYNGGGNPSYPLKVQAVKNDGSALYLLR